ncbi:MAG: Rrf2 family transcriptional regulator [Candidatus Tectomicrobia bacterium]|uniref:Rrf2 family transcriptional regulator n=1 Tax=Tectimicrobiota bacterium TaxID=2528274 RepID=A0A933GM86_UNCTE|nr:Rrf2 family transcriptional regulator [Candidatus Tectomicrobia bacterium]
MKITRKSDYAVRCVLFLLSKPDGLANVIDISRQMHIPKSFLAKILQQLLGAGIVESIRGIKGGFRSAKKPEDISLYDVIKAVGDPVVMNVCAVDKKMCALSQTCSVHPVWVDLRDMVEKYLKKVNFACLVDQYRQRPEQYLGRRNHERLSV